MLEQVIAVKWMNLAQTKDLFDFAISQRENPHDLNMEKAILKAIGVSDFEKYSGDLKTYILFTIKELSIANYLALKKFKLIEMAGEVFKLDFDKQLMVEILKRSDTKALDEIILTLNSNGIKPELKFQDISDILLIACREGDVLMLRRLQNIMQEDFSILNLRLLFSALLENPSMKVLQEVLQLWPKSFSENRREDNQYSDLVSETSAFQAFAQLLKAGDSETLLFLFAMLPMQMRKFLDPRQFPVFHPKDSPLQTALESTHKNEALCLFIIRNSNNPRDLMHEDMIFNAVEFGFRSLLGELLNEKFDPNKTDALGKSPLMRAIEHQDEVMVELLLSGGGEFGKRANPNPIVLHRKKKVEEAPKIEEQPSSKTYLPLFSPEKGRPSNTSVVEETGRPADTVLEETGRPPNLPL